MVYVPPTHWVDDLSKAKTGRLQSTALAYNGPPLRIAFGHRLVDAAQDDTIGLFEIDTSAHLSFGHSLIRWPAYGASVTMSIGIATDAALGIASKTALLASAVAVAAAGSGSLLSAVSIADAKKPLWELIGLAKDPKAKVLVIKTLAGANPASGEFIFEQGFFAA